MNSPKSTDKPLFFNLKQFKKKLKKEPALTVFKDAVLGANTHITMRFHEGESVRKLVNEKAQFVDIILREMWQRFSWDDDIVLIAVGGYGRGELHPHSDIDILVLLEDKAQHKYKNTLQEFITQLWDISLNIGSSVRTLTQCRKIAKKDLTVATSILEARTIAGNDLLRDSLQILSNSKHIWPAEKFYHAKKEEQNKRHQKHNDTGYDLEPNIKNSPGGLRDIQTVQWIAKRFYGIRTLTELYGKNFFTEDEFALLVKCETFLWRVRFALHSLTGRAEERLLFEHQREIADLFNYRDNNEQLAVEQFMNDYYLSTLAISQLNDVLLKTLEEKILDKKNKIKPINDRFQLNHNYIEVTSDTVFDHSPSALLEIFLLVGKDKNIKGMRAQTIRLIQKKKYLIDEKFRNDPENNKLFLAFFSLDHGLVTQLRRMSRYGILGLYLPEFGRIIGQMQHDLFHRYTVDAHTLLVIRNMLDFREKAAEKNFPVAAHVSRRLPKPELLYIAGLYHDIAKGRGGDHSILGAMEAQLFCERHGISPRETRLVVWLVENHLLMSYVSQKQDISDPEVIINFATNVSDQTRLDYLYALTVADMCGTNPNIWNSWRASLLRQLYIETKRHLRRGLEQTPDKEELVEDTKFQALSRLLEKNISKQTAHEIWKNLEDEYFVREGHLDIVWQTELIASHKNSDKPLVALKESSRSEFEGATQLFVYAKDSNSVFNIVASCLARLKLNIQDARIHTTRLGYVLDTFYLLDEDSETIGNDPKLYKRIVSVLTEALTRGELDIDIPRRLTPRQLKQFSLPSQAYLSSDMNHDYTILEVIGPDRPGILAVISRIFFEMGIKLHNARISTLGERIEDIFFISNADNRAISDPKTCEQLKKTVQNRIDEYVQELITSQ